MAKQREVDVIDANTLAQDIWSQWNREPKMLEDSGLTFADAMAEASERMGFAMGGGQQPILNGPDGRKLRVVYVNGQAVAFA